MSIYTKKGDKGKTSLFKEKDERVSKNSAKVEAIGTVDELNSFLGMIISEIEGSDLSEEIKNIQRNLFTIGSMLAGSDLEFSDKTALGLERRIDEWDRQLPVLKNFVLPGGGRVGAKFHFARSVTRRAERKLVALSEKNEINPAILKYVNRLSDYFFVAARKINSAQNSPEEVWKGKES